MPAAFDPYFESMDESLLSVMGEECTYYPKSGPSRSITAAVDEDAEVREAQAGLTNQQRIFACVMRDASHADYGGIAEPQIGDGFARENGEVYSFTGVKREVSHTAWVLEFSRNLPYALGGNRRQ